MLTRARIFGKSPASRITPRTENEICALRARCAVARSIASRNEPGPESCRLFTMRMPWTAGLSASEPVALGTSPASDPREPHAVSATAVHEVTIAAMQRRPSCKLPNIVSPSNAVSALNRLASNRELVRLALASGAGDACYGRLALTVQRGSIAAAKRAATHGATSPIDCD